MAWACGIAVMQLAGQVNNGLPQRSCAAIMLLMLSQQIKAGGGQRLRRCLCHPTSVLAETASRPACVQIIGQRIPVSGVRLQWQDGTWGDMKTTGDGYWQPVTGPLNAGPQQAYQGKSCSVFSDLVQHSLPWPGCTCVLLARSGRVHPCASRA